MPKDKHKIIASFGQKLVEDEDALQSFQKDPIGVLRKEGIDLGPEMDKIFKAAQDPNIQPQAIGVAIGVAIAVFLAPMGEAR